MASVSPLRQPGSRILVNVMQEQRHKSTMANLIYSVTATRNYYNQFHKNREHGALTACKCYEPCSAPVSK